MNTRILKKAAALALAISFLIYNTAAYALPQGFTVESGSVTFDTSDPNAVTIHASDKAIIDSVSGSIAANETVRFIQDSSSNSLLWRVTGGSVSDIYGSLFSNGTLFLINPAGITFHAGANIQVQNLIASTLNIQNAMYLSNKFTFEKAVDSNPGKIINEANIISNGGSIILLAEQIDNKGVLKADLGTVVLGVGEKQTLTFDDNGFVNLVVDRGLTNTPADGKAAITNEGTIQANGGTVYLTAKMFNDTMDTLINNTGVIQATRAVEKDGKVVFEANGVAQSQNTVNATDLEIKKGTTLKGGNTHFSIERDWDNHGRFVGENSRVEFVSLLNSHILGNNTFNDFIATTPSKCLYFDTQNTQTILGDWIIQGAYGQHIRLLSMEDGVQWKVNPLGKIDISYAWVQDADNINGSKITMRESTNRGNSIGWDPTATWTNTSGDGLWSDAANWAGLGGATPGAGDDAVFDGTSDTDSTVDSTFTIGSLSLNLGYTHHVIVSGSLVVTTAGGGSGNIVLSSGFLGGTGNITVNGGSVTGDSSPGSFAIVMSGGIFNMIGSGSIGSNGGTFLFNDFVLGDGLTSGATAKVGGNIIIIEGNMNIAASHTLNAGNSNWDPHGNFINNGVFNGEGSAFSFSGPGLQILNGGNLGTGFTNFSHDNPGSGSGTLQLVGNNLTVKGFFHNTAGTFDANGLDMTVSSDFTNMAGFTAGAGTVFLNGTNQTVSGSTTFNNLTKTVASADILTFDHTGTQTITGTLILQGSAGNLLSLRSDADGVQWAINPQGARNISFVDVKDSHNTNPLLIVPPNSINSLNNTNWFVSPPPASAPVSVVPPASAIMPTVPAPAINVDLPGTETESASDISNKLGQSSSKDTLHAASHLNPNLDMDEEDNGEKTKVFVDEGAVSVTGTDGSENMVYDGENIAISKKGTSLSIRALYVSSLNGLLALRGKTYERLKEFIWKERPSALVASKDGGSVLAASPKQKALIQIDTGSFESSSIQGLNENISSIVLNKKADTAYAADAKNDVVQVFNVPSKKLSREFRTGSMPTKAILSPDETKLYVVERLDARLSEYDALSGKRMASIKTGTSPFGAVMSSDGLNLYVTDTESNQIFKIDAKLMKVISQIKVTDSPYTVQINPKDPDKLYVANRLGKSVSIIDLKQGREIGKIAVGERPSDIAVLPEGDKLYVTNELSNNLSVINLKQQKTIQEIPTGTAPNHVVLSTPERR